jgi:hypothetical protein
VSAEGAEPPQRAASHHHATTQWDANVEWYRFGQVHPAIGGDNSGSRCTLLWQCSLMHGPQRCGPGLSEDDLARNRPLIGEHRIEGTSHIFKPHCFHPRHLLAMDSEEPTKSLFPPPDEFVSLTDPPYFVSLCCYVV